MHITGFLILGIIFLSLLCVFAIVERTNFFLYSNKHYNILNSKSSIGLWVRGAYLLFFAVMASMAVSVMKTYIYPTDESIFRNVDYHVLSHKGYVVGEKVYLANGFTTEGNGYPENSLWDSKDGIVMIDGVDSNFVIKEYTEPLYIRKDSHRAWWQFWKDEISRSYHLVNQVISEDLTNGFTLTRDNDTLYVLRIEPINNEKYLYISTIYNSNHTHITDTSTFQKPIRIGYPILDIIARSPRIGITEDMESWFEGAYLIRTEIPMAGNTPSFNSKSPSSLCLMPGLSFYQNYDLKINGVAYDYEQTFVIPFDEYDTNGKVTFYSGVGKKKTEEFRLSYLPDNKMRLEFLMPDIRQIKDTLGRVFINSSIDDISKETLNGGYLYNRFANEDNHHHINAHLQYIVGDARSEMSINIKDLNSIDEELPEYKCNNEFLLHSRDKTSNAISWIFEVTDLRKTNDLSSNNILAFILVMFVMVAIRVLSDSFFERYTLSLTELAIYVILFSLCVVRLILGWRSSTFVPVEDISLPMYLKMRMSIFNECTWLVAYLPLLVTLFVGVWKRYNKKMQSQHKISTLMSNVMFCIIVYICMLALCYILSHITILSRLCNIVIPIILYFLFEIWMNTLKERGVQDIILFRIIAFGLTFVYLSIADAGFTIILLAYMMIHYFIFGSLYWGINNRSWRQYSKFLYIISIISAIILFVILYFEGDIMIGLFQYIGLLMTVISAVLLVAVIILIIKRKQWVAKWNKTIRVITCSICAVFFVICLLDVVKVYPTITTILNSKAHMRYRAEVQRLSGDEKIDDLIQQCEFDSDDIIFIMRSAHNQWFINQYIRAGQKMEENNEYFHLQPHSNQGATYSTQTTDLVVTRYLLAEHGEGAVRCILFIWMILILLYVLEFKMKYRINRIFLNGPIMIYAVSLIVYLSATNRIVFVGQDFPLISLQSRVAILFPLFLLILLLGRSLYIRSKETSHEKCDSVENIRKGIVFSIVLLLFTWGCMRGIEQKGKDQEETQFNVSRLISDLSLKVDDINDKFLIFQENEQKLLRKKTVKEVWTLFTEKENSNNKIYYKYLNPATPDFFSSLLHYFNDEQTSKTDVNQLLHLRRRGGKCYLSLNKRHYFIPAIMREESMWTGDIYAAKVEPEMMLFEHSKKAIKVDETKDYEKNVLLSNVKKQIPDMPLMRFDKEWIPGDKSLFIVSSKQGQSHSVFFNIGTDSLEIMGDGSNNQIATAVLPGDLLSLYKRNHNRRNAQVILNGNMKDDGTPYIVRNMWLNGHKRLFFPLGKQLMWSYHLGNLVSDVYSKDPSLRDTTLYLSLDYDLCKAFYTSINKQISERIIAPKTLAILDILEDFRNKNFEQQCDSRNDFYYDKFEEKLVVKANVTNENLRKAVLLVNRELKKYEYLENPLSKALDVVLQKQYDFTAVALDGDGHIRALFDYSRNRHLDPNNLTHLNKVISELYQEGSTADERDIFGSKALHYIPVGPGSSFKPIAYTSITSQEKINWESINLTKIGMAEAKSKDSEVTKSGSIPYVYYGGVSLKKGQEFNIQGGVVDYRNYLVKSNNLYHSIIILLGMQNQGEVEKIIRPYTANIDKKKAFPVFTYDNGRLVCFDPSIWYENKLPLIEDHDLLTEGLYRNFRIMESAPRLSDSYTYLFGNNELVNKLYDDGNSSRGWVFPETSSLNNADRNQNPLKVGFNQILLGADPLLQTPLQMAVNASRLASLNRSKNMVSILDEEIVPNYEFFDVGSSNGWTEQTYLDFVKRQIWAQLRNVPKSGTARGLNGLVRDMENGKYGRPYYLYCKTGTLNDDRTGQSRNDRMKHLLVIITDRPLEQVENVSKLSNVRYYALYLSYIGIDNDSFNNNKFLPFIKDVLNSNSFKCYMNKK